MCKRTQRCCPNLDHSKRIGLNTRDNNGCTAFIYACSRGHKDVGRFPGNSREIPEKYRSRTFPGIIFGSREFLGNLYVLWRDKFLNLTIFQRFFFRLRSTFTVEKERKSKLKISVIRQTNTFSLNNWKFLIFYIVSFKFPGIPGNSQTDFREIPVTGNENLSGNCPP